MLASLSWRASVDAAQPLKAENDPTAEHGGADPAAAGGPEIVPALGEIVAFAMVAALNQGGAAPLHDVHMLREGAQGLLGGHRRGLVAVGEQAVGLVEVDQAGGARGEGEDQVEGMSDLAGQLHRLFHPLQGALRTAGDPVGETARPVLGEDQRVVVGEIDVMTGVAGGPIGGLHPVGVGQRAGKIRFPEVLTAGGHAKDHEASPSAGVRRATFSNSSSHAWARGKSVRVW